MFSFFGIGKEVSPVFVVFRKFPVLQFSTDLKITVKSTFAELDPQFLY